jgi:hypothetical protein
MRIMQHVILVLASISTSACGTFGRSHSEISVAPPQRIPPAECQAEPAERATYQPPPIPERIVTGPALAIAINRAERAEPLAASALDFMQADRTEDAERDAIMARCAGFNRETVRLLQEQSQRDH